MGGNPQNAGDFSTAAKVTATQANTPIAEICEPCATWFRVEAHYDDPWKTPITLAPLRVQYVNGGVISEGARTYGLPSFGLQDGQQIDDVRPDLGMHQDRAPEHGPIRAAIVPEGGPDPKALEAQIIADLQAFSNGMETAMAPWRLEWENEGWFGLLGNLWGDFTAGTTAWWNGEKEFWGDVKTFIYSLDDYVVAAWDTLSEGAKALWENKDQIFALLENLIDGSVEAFEAGMEAVADLLSNFPDLEEIALIFRDLVENSAEWAGAMIEFVRDTSILSAIAATVFGAIMMMPPNFWSEMIAKGVGYLIPELVLVVISLIIAFFTVGAGSALLAQRIASYASKIKTLLAGAGNAARVLASLIDLLKSIKDKVAALIKALKARISEFAVDETGSVTRITRRTQRVTGKLDDWAPDSPPPPARNPSAKQLATAEQNGVDPRWVREDGTLIYPERSRGFESAPDIVRMEPGERFDRYGGYFDAKGRFIDHGDYGAPIGSSFEGRAMPNGHSARDVYSYEVVKPLEGVLEGKAAPWFGQAGGGIQQQFPDSIQNLLKAGKIRKLP